MKSLKYYGPGNLQVDESPIPTVNDGEVLVEVTACGICATDLKTFLRGHPKIKPGTALGHEISGIVREAPASKTWKPGMKVVVAPYVPCGSCSHCRQQRYSLCPSLFNVLLDPGGFSEFVRVPSTIASEGMFLVPDQAFPGASCFAEPIACCLHGLDLINTKAGDSLAIIGDGVMGLLQARIGKALGAKPIFLSGMTPDRLAKARGFVDFVVDAREENIAKVVHRETSGEGADKVMVSVADVRAAEAAIQLVRKGGAINLFAGMPSGSTLSLDMNRIHYDEIVLTGSFGFGPKDFQMAVEMISKGTLPITDLVTSYVSLDQTVGALEKLARQEGVKTIVLCGGK